ncbi:MAG: peptidylprolyl isomerase [bacterium]
MLALTLGASPTRAQAIAIDKVLVVVNEEPITLSEYQARHQREALQQSAGIAPFDGRIDARVLDQMIDDRIQAQTALRRGIRIPAQEIDRAIAFIAEQNQIPPKLLLERIASGGISKRQFRASIREQQLISRLVDAAVNARVAVSEREVENYLATHQELNALTESYELSHLFVSLAGKSDAEVQGELENLAHIHEGLVAGRDFADAARTLSDGPDSEQGGYLGWRRVEQLPPAFVRTVRDTQVGAISEIFRTGNGLHLLKLHQRKREGQIAEQQLIRHILIRPSASLNVRAARELAESLHARIRAGEDYEKLARVHSADRATGINGGLLGWLSPGDFPPDFEQAVRKLELNQTSAPLRTRNGYHLVQVLERRRHDISGEIAGKQARQIIFRRKAAELYENWRGTLRDLAHIEYVAADPI